jgi:lysophospholipase L1-like esterase
MALEQITFNIGAFNDSDAGGNNYFTDTVFEVKNQSDNTFATIYADSSGATQIPQNGIDNVSNSRGECSFYIDDGDFYIEVSGATKNFSIGRKASSILNDSGGSVQDYMDANLIDAYKTKQIVNSGNAARRVCVDESLKITCRGDSLTYGEATNTGTQPADSTPTQSGRVHNKPRASVTYPQRLQSSLQSVFANTITVVNQGYSGDNTFNGYNDWEASVDSDITFIMYGTNDAADGFSPYQTIDNYVKYYELIIRRELDFGSAVVVMLPPQQKQFSTNTRLLNAYRNSARKLADKYGCVCVDMAEAIRGCDSSIFDDNAHFKTEGYAKIAEAVASVVIAKIESYEVSGNDSLSVRIDETPIKYDFTKWGTQTAKSGQKSPPLTSFTGGYVIESNTYGAKVSFSFYAETDDLIFQPSMYLQNANCLISLDNESPQMQYSLDDKVQTDIIGINDTPASSKTLSKVDSSFQYDRAASLVEQKQSRLHISKKGWHTVSLELIDNSSSGSPLLTLWGASLIDYDAVNAMDKSKEIRSGEQVPSGNITPNFIGEVYLDTTSGQYETYMATGLSVNSWKLLTLNINNILRTGSQNPTNNITPRFVGEQWLDTSSGQYKWYQSTGLTSASWKQSTNEPVTP